MRGAGSFEQPGATEQRSGPLPAQWARAAVAASRMAKADNDPEAERVLLSVARRAVDAHLVALREQRP